MAILNQTPRIIFYGVGFLWAACAAVWAGDEAANVAALAKAIGEAR